MAFNRAPIDAGCPCVKDCEGRDAECHGKCERYLTWREARDAKLVEQFEERCKLDTMSYAKKQAIWKKMRYPRRAGGVGHKEG